MAQNYVASERTFDERLRGAGISSLKNDLFGDQINLKDGSLQFSQTDVSVPTSSGLRVAFSRHTPRQKQGLDRESATLGASWEIDVPYMMGSYDKRRGWDAAGGGRCSAQSLFPTEWVGPSPYYNTRLMPRGMYWSGIFINIPEAGYEQLLQIESGLITPQDGASYIGTTASNWRVSCIASIKNGAGEGFVVRTPDGSRYFFDWIVVRNQNDVLASQYYRDSNGDGTAPPYLLVPVVDVFLYATRVEDKFGNYVTYEYFPSNPNRLKSITSNDGARIDLNYDGYGKVSEVVQGGQTWRYNYIDNYWGRTLSEVVLPDQSRWQYSSSRHAGAMPWLMVPATLDNGFYENACAQSAVGFRSQDPIDPAYADTIIMRHPSGAQGTFSLRRLVHGSDNTPGGCGVIGTSETNFGFGGYGIPSAYMATSLISKTISGPGINGQTWSYSYSPRWSFTGGCATNCISMTTEIQPDGNKNEYIYGNDYTSDIGDLKTIRNYQGPVLAQTTVYSRATTPSGYPERYGKAFASWANPLVTKIRPIYEVKINRDGVIHTQHVEVFDSFARPVQVVRSSTAP